MRSTILKSLKNSLGELTLISTRGLTLFRTAFAICVIFELVERLTLVDFLFSPKGLLPEAIVQGHWQRYAAALGIERWGFLDWTWAMGESATTIAIALQLMCAVALFLGVATQIMAGILFISFAVFYSRISFLTTGSDSYLSFASFWLMLLPATGPLLSEIRRWRAPCAVRSPIIAFFLLHFMFTYLSAGLSKSAPEWRNGFALFGILRGSFLSHWDWIEWERFRLPLEIGNYLFVALELALPLTFLVLYRRIRARPVFAAIGISFHVASSVVARLGVLPYLCISIWLAFLVIPRESQPAKIRGRRLEPAILGVLSVILMIQMLMSASYLFSKEGAAYSKANQFAFRIQELGIGYGFSHFERVLNANGRLRFEARSAESDWRPVGFDHAASASATDQKLYPDILSNRRHQRLLLRLLLNTRPRSIERLGFRNFLCGNWRTRNWPEAREFRMVVEARYVLNFSFGWPYRYTPFVTACRSSKESDSSSRDEAARLENLRAGSGTQVAEKSSDIRVR